MSNPTYGFPQGELMVFKAVAQSYGEIETELTAIDKQNTCTKRVMSYALGAIGLLSLAIGAYLTYTGGIQYFVSSTGDGLVSFGCGAALFTGGIVLLAFAYLVQSRARKIAEEMDKVLETFNETVISSDSLFTLIQKASNDEIENFLAEAVVKGKYNDLLEEIQKKFFTDHASHECPVNLLNALAKSHTALKDSTHSFNPSFATKLLELIAPNPSTSEVRKKLVLFTDVRVVSDAAQAAYAENPEDLVNQCIQSKDFSLALSSYAKLTDPALKNRFFRQLIQRKDDLADIGKGLTLKILNDLPADLQDAGFIDKLFAQVGPLDEESAAVLAKYPKKVAEMLAKGHDQQEILAIFGKMNTAFVAELVTALQAYHEFPPLDERLGSSILKEIKVEEGAEYPFELVANLLKALCPYQESKAELYASHPVATIKLFTDKVLSQDSIPTIFSKMGDSQKEIFLAACEKKAEKNEDLAFLQPIEKDIFVFIKGKSYPSLVKALLPHFKEEDIYSTYPNRLADDFIQGKDEGEVFKAYSSLGDNEKAEFLKGLFDYHSKDSQDKKKIEDFVKKAIESTLTLEFAKQAKFPDALLDALALWPSLLSTHLLQTKSFMQGSLVNAIGNKMTTGSRKVFVEVTAQVFNTPDKVGAVCNFFKELFDAYDENSMPALVKETLKNSIKPLVSYVLRNFQTFDKLTPIMKKIFDELEEQDKHHFLEGLTQNPIFFKSLVEDHLKDLNPDENHPNDYLIKFFGTHPTYVKEYAPKYAHLLFRSVADESKLTILESMMKTHEPLLKILIERELKALFNMKADELKDKIVIKFLEKYPNPYIAKFVIDNNELGLEGVRYPFTLNLFEVLDTKVGNLVVSMDTFSFGNPRYGAMLKLLLNETQGLDPDKIGEVPESRQKLIARFRYADNGSRFNKADKTNLKTDNFEAIAKGHYSIEKK